MSAFIKSTFRSASPSAPISVDKGRVDDASVFCRMRWIGHSVQSLHGAPPGVVYREKQGATRVPGPLRVAGLRYRETHETTCRRPRPRRSSVIPCYSSLTCWRIVPSSASTGRSRGGRGRQPSTSSWPRPTRNASAGPPPRSCA